MEWAFAVFFVALAVYRTYRREQVEAEDNTPKWTGGSCQHYEKAFTERATHVLGLGGLPHED